MGVLHSNIAEMVFASEEGASKPETCAAGEPSEDMLLEVKNPETKSAPEEGVSKPETCAAEVPLEDVPLEEKTPNIDSAPEEVASMSETCAAPVRADLWEVWWSEVTRGANFHLFETKDAAYKYFDSMWSSKVLFGPAGFEQEKAGLLDNQSIGIQLIHEAKRRRQSREGRWWTLAFYSHKDSGVGMETFRQEEEARAAFHKSACSKVLWNDDAALAACSTAPSDPHGLGMALIFKLCCEGGGSSDQSAADAVKAGDIPFIPPDRRTLQQMALTGVVSTLFSRPLVAAATTLASPARSLCYFDQATFPGVKGYVALTIDDAPSALGKSNSMMKEVLQLLEDHEASATFMLMGKFAEGHEEDLVQLLKEGHELGNHGMLDKPYNQDSKQEFAAAVDACSKKIFELQSLAGVPQSVKWFRAPHGRYSPDMEEVVLERDLTHVLCDTYACCPVIQNGAFIGDFLARSAQSGSIIVIHMPSHGLREWCYEGLKRFLEGLAQKNLRAVSVSKLEEKSKADQRLRLQWTRDKLKWSRRLSLLAEADAFKNIGVHNWSARQLPQEMCDDLDQHKSLFPIMERAVRVRVAGQQLSALFESPQAASDWIRRELLQEYTIILDNRQGELVVSGDASSDEDLFYGSISGCSLESSSPALARTASCPQAIPRGLPCPQSNAPALARSVSFPQQAQTGTSATGPREDDQIVAVCAFGGVPVRRPEMLRKMRYEERIQLTLSPGRNRAQELLTSWDGLSEPSKPVADMRRSTSTPVGLVSMPSVPDVSAACASAPLGLMSPPSVQDVNAVSTSAPVGRISLPSVQGVSVDRHMNKFSLRRDFFSQSRRASVSSNS